MTCLYLGDPVVQLSPPLLGLLPLLLGEDELPLQPLPGLLESQSLLGAGSDIRPFQPRI